MIDVVDMRLVALAAEIEHVADDREEVLGTDVLDRLGRELPELAALAVLLVVLELAVDAEAADAAEAVAVLVEELLGEQRLRLVDLRRVARTQTAVDLEEGGLVLGHAREEVELLFGEGVEDQRVACVGDDADRRQGLAQVEERAHA